MRRIFVIAFCFAVLCAGTPLFGERFLWSVKKDVRYSVTTDTQQEHLINGERQGGLKKSHSSAVFHAVSVSNTNAALYKGEFKYYEGEEDERNLPLALKDIFPTEFWRDAYGKYFVKPDIFMPVLRDVPLFTKDDMYPGGMWQAEGHEVHNLTRYGLAGAHRIPFTVRYIYTGDHTAAGKRIASFSISYVFNYFGGIDTEKHKQEARTALSRYRIGSVEYNTLRAQQEQEWTLLQYAPQRITGSSIRQLDWDIEARLPYSADEDYHFIFTLVNGSVVEYKGKSWSNFELIPDREREAEAVMKTLQNYVETAQNTAAGTHQKAAPEASGISVHRDERGIVLELGDILFDIDSAQLKPEARARLTELARRINASGEFKVRVEGHTDNTGTAEYNMRLSQSRASEVAVFLSQALDTNARNISWIGHGLTRPTASNFTAAGRAQNRRVEIILLTNE